MLGCIQPMSSPMMNRMLGLGLGACAPSAGAASVATAVANNSILHRIFSRTPEEWTKRLRRRSREQPNLMEAHAFAHIPTLVRQPCHPSESDLGTTGIRPTKRAGHGASARDAAQPLHVALGKCGVVTLGAHRSPKVHCRNRVHPEIVALPVRRARSHVVDWSPLVTASAADHAWDGWVPMIEQPALYEADCSMALGELSEKEAQFQLEDACRSTRARACDDHRRSEPRLLTREWGTERDGLCESRASCK